MNKIRVDEFMYIKGISNPTFSKDGCTFAFVLSNINKEDDTYESYIYVKKENNDFIKLTSFGKEASFQFLDNENIIFTASRKPNAKQSGTKYYKININGGEAEQYLEFPINVTELLPLKNGDFILSAINNPLYKNKELIKNDKKLKEYEEYIKNNQDYEILDEVPFYYNGLGFTKSRRINLYYYHSLDKTIEELTPFIYNVGNFCVNEEENVIFFSANKETKMISFDKCDYFAYDLVNKKIVKLFTSKEIYGSDMIVYKNGFYFGGHHKETGVNTDPDFYYYDFNKKNYEKVASFGYCPYNTVGTDIRIGGGRQWKVTEKGTLYFICTYFDSAYLYKLENKKIEKVFEHEGSIENFDIYKNKIVFVALYDMQAQELYEYDLNSKDEVKKISNFNDYLKDYYIAKPEKLSFKSVQDEIHGFILKPINYDESKTYPVILDVHGGPKTIYSEVFYHEMQYWTSEGYFVIYCNPTGSDGRGRKFADIRGKYGSIDYLDIMNFVDECIRLYPQMDKNHLYETGGSYGGFMTNWIIGHTNRFKACASQRSISNWLSFYGTSDIGVLFACDQNEADLWKDTAKMWNSSPLKYAVNVKTPTLFIHSNEDYRCPMEQGMQMYTALISNKIDAKLVYFKGENHELSRSGKPSHRLKRLNEITNWFKNHK